MWVGIRCVVFHINNYLFDDECKMYLKWFKSIEGENENIVAWHLYKKVVRRKKRRHFQKQEMKKKNLFKLKPKLAWGHLVRKKM